METCERAAGGYESGVGEPLPKVRPHGGGVPRLRVRVGRQERRPRRQQHDACVRTALVLMFLFYINAMNSSAHLRWTRLQCRGTIPPARDGHSACVIGDQMIVFGGFEEEFQRFSQETYAFDFRNCKWMELRTKVGTSYCETLCSFRAGPSAALARFPHRPRA